MAGALAAGFMTTRYARPIQLSAFRPSATAVGCDVARAAPRAVREKAGYRTGLPP